MVQIGRVAEHSGQLAQGAQGAQRGPSRRSERPERAKVARSVSRGLRTTRRAYVSGAAGVGSAVLAIGTAAGSAHAQTPVPGFERKILIDADWLGTDNARGRHAQFWVDSWREAHPSYTIDMQAKGDEIVRLASDTYGHMIQFPPTTFAIVKGKPGLFVDITDEFAARGYTDDAIMGIPEVEKFEGRRFGIPLQTNVFGWMYNRGKFEQAGLRLPDATWTYEDAIEAARRLTRADSPPEQWGIRWRWNWDILPVLRAARVSYLSPDKERVTLDTPQGVDALQFILDVVQRYKVAPTDQWMTENNAAFAPIDIALGYFGMLDGSTGTKATANTLAPTGIRFENMWPPLWRSTRTRSVLIDGHPYMTMDRALRDGVDAACVDLMFHLLNETVQEQYLIQGTGMPSLRKMAYDERYIGGPPDSLHLVPDIWASGQTYDRFAGGINMLQAWTPHLRRAWNGEIGARELAQQLSRDGTAAIQGVRAPAWGR